MKSEGKKIVKTDITDGVCLVTVQIRGNALACLNSIKKEMNKRNAKVYYSCVQNLMNKDKNLVIATDENDLYPVLSSMGCINDNSKIKGYTLNCSNTLITWEKSSCNIYEIAKGYEDKVRLTYEIGKRGCIICESEIKQKIAARIEDM